jgi:hypothetical protein
MVAKHHGRKIIQEFFSGENSHNNSRKSSGETSSIERKKFVI